MNLRLLILFMGVVTGVMGQDDLEQRVEVLEVEDVNINSDVDTLQTNVSQNTAHIFEVINDDIDDLTSTQEQRNRILEEENSLLRMRLDELEQTFVLMQQALNVTDQKVEEHDLAIQALDEATDQRLSALEDAILVPWTACTSSPCQNGGTCVDVNVDAFICMCRDGFFGVDCDSSYSDTAFLATFSDTYVTPSDPIVFDDAILNLGSHYDATSGIYTVPLDGIYQFVLHYMNYLDMYTVAYLMVDSFQTAYARAADDTYSYPRGDLVVTLSLTAGQQVWISPFFMEEIYGSSGNLMYSWFSGHLLYAQ